MANFLETKIDYLKGIGPQKAEALQKDLGIFTFYDLLFHYPHRYEDRSRIYKIIEAQTENLAVQLCGKISILGIEGKGPQQRLRAELTDETGTIELIWFQGVQWIIKSIKDGGFYLVYGKINIYKGFASISHPEIEQVASIQTTAAKGLVPVYPLTEGVKRRRIDSKLLYQAALQIITDKNFSVPEILPPSIIAKLKLLSRTDALSQLHRSNNLYLLEKAQYRIKFEELFILQMRYLLMKAGRNREIQGVVFSKVGNVFNRFYLNHLPYPLTNAQMRVIKEMRQDMGSGKQMNRLLQGDVGSGKTIVALLCMLLALDNGYQACIMAPTEILAFQHFENFNDLLVNSGIKPYLLTGSTTKKQKASMLESLANGEIPLLVGTHALLEEDVVFQNLGLVVIDEQHRFGVAQRAKLWKKGKLVPHIMVMTATPIPRTLAMTVYGELDVSVIDELPAGRKAIKTVHRNANMRPAIMEFVAAEIKKGRQVYFVFPLIEESEKLQLADLMSGFDMINNYLPQPEYKYAIVHGRMKPAEKEAEMARFKNKQADILVATTVIEVGVNVPNATVMVIENADRFGLAQLHQLRGRVGRGAEQSFCVLITGDKLSKNAQRRIKTMTMTNDGFEIAKVDMEIRGFGDMDGTRQSGEMDLKLADIIADENILIQARLCAEQIVEDDPLLMKEEHYGLRAELAQKPHRSIWSKIS